MLKESDEINDLCIKQLIINVRFIKAGNTEFYWTKK